MVQFRILVHMNSKAFKERPPEREVCAILHRIADSLDGTLGYHFKEHDTFDIADSNDQLIGKWKIVK